jgi:iron(III) transport system ATP-binding protein
MGVKLVNITKIFQDLHHPGKEVVAVRDVNIDVNDGEFVTLLGPSGCGKTTTLRIVSGFEQPTRGEVWISGKMVNEDPPNKRDTSMVFQSYAIFPHLSVAQNIGFGLELKKRPRNEIRQETERIMEVMNLQDLANRRPDQLSGGQQQRVALARAIINKPSVLLFDEPLSNLDAKLREQMRLEIRRIQQTFGITSIYVTHDQAEAMTVSDRIVVMNEGNIMQIGTPFEIYSRPVSRFVADFIGRVNFFQGTVRSVSDSLDTSFKETGDSDPEVPYPAQPRGLEVEFSGGIYKEIPSYLGTYTKGSPVLVIVRPESLKLFSLEATSPAVPAAGGGSSRIPFLTGTIDKVVYLGSVCEYEIEVGLERPVLAVSYNPVEEGFFKPGNRVGIDFSAVSAHALPQKEAL